MLPIRFQEHLQVFNIRPLGVKIYLFLCDFTPFQPIIPVIYCVLSIIWLVWYATMFYFCPNFAYLTDDFDLYSIWIDIFRGCVMILSLNLHFSSSTHIVNSPLFLLLTRLHFYFLFWHEHTWQSLSIFRINWRLDIFQLIFPFTRPCKSDLRTIWFINTSTSPRHIFLPYVPFLYQSMHVYQTWGLLEITIWDETCPVFVLTLLPILCSDYFRKHAALHHFFFPSIKKTFTFTV